MKNLIFLGLLLFLVSCKQQKPSSTTISLNEGEVVEMKNTSNKTSCFILKSKEIPSNQEELFNAIEALPNLYKNEPNYEKAWRFIVENIAYQPTSFESFDFHHPLLLLNSIGYGQCDDLATALHFLWQMQGYESRIWEVGNHVVPEILVNNQWQMYDPSFQVYFYNENMEVASVEDLLDDQELILSPKNRINYFFEDLRNKNTIDSLRYSEQVAQYFLEKEKVSTNKNYSKTYHIDSLLFCLPANSSIQFPIKADKFFKEKNWIGEDISLNYFLKLNLQKSSFGKIAIPFLAIQSTGNFELENNLNQTVSNQEINAFLLDMDLNIKEISENANIFYKISQSWLISKQFEIQNYNSNAISIQKF